MKILNIVNDITSHFFIKPSFLYNYFCVTLTLLIIALLVATLSSPFNTSVLIFQNHHYLLAITNNAANSQF